MAYVLPKEISSSVKLTKNLYVFDLFFIGTFFYWYIYVCCMDVKFFSISSIKDFLLYIYGYYGTLF